MKQSILFICPSFFGYEKLINETYITLGFDVTYIDEKPNSLIDRYYRILKKTKLEDYYSKNEDYVLSKITHNFDFLIVIRSGYLSKNFYDKLYKKVSFKKRILYQWDSLIYINYRRLIPYFDVVYSFDMEDCKLLGLNYLPLFWTKENIKKTYKLKYDILFCGSMNADRQEILLKILNHCKKNNLNLSIYLYTPITTFINLLLNHKKKLPLKYLHFIKLSHKAFYKKCLQSRSVLDINTAKQCGLTMRTFEVLYLKKFLFTTNKNIKNEIRIPNDKYRVIDLIDQESWDFSINEKMIDESYINNFSIETWCRNIITSN